SAAPRPALHAPAAPHADTAAPRADTAERNTCNDPI
ncbi:hypothetical protein A2U01_0100942, partial [Trifolium medium]|nr:hypothetical protein [Trifolium medium]